MMSEPVDMSVIESLRDLGDDELVLELVEIFMEDTPPRLEELAKAYIDGDAERIESVAHSLKSSCANLGAIRLSEICRDLEAKGREGELAQAEELIVLSQEEYQRVSESLQNCLE